MGGSRTAIVTAAAAAVTAVWIAVPAHAPASDNLVLAQVAPTVVATAPSAGPGGASVAAATIAPIYPALAHAEPETRLIEILDTLRRGDVDTALIAARELVTEKPNFRLAQLVYGDLLASRAGVPLSLDDGSSMPRASVDLLFDEARQRWRHYRGDPPAGKLPAPLIRLADSQRHVLLVDLSQSRLFIFENVAGEANLIGDHYVSVGKNGASKRRQGDRKTPVGVYFVVDRLPGEDLPDKYGPVAFPVDYPNAWDRRHGRTGDGIWLHGVSSTTYSRPPLDSDGCVAMSNEDLERVAPMLESGVTPIVIAEDLDWLEPERLYSERSGIESTLAQWRSDWESGDTDRYLAHYSDDFRGRGMDHDGWAAYKRQVNRNKRFIQVALDDRSVFSYPGERDMIVVTFRQQYRSDNFSSVARKRQYWRLEGDGRWRILSEDTV